MTLDEISTALRTSPLPPEDALRAGVAHADALAPLVYERLTRLCGGECLLPDDESLLYYGLHVLAAARHAELWPRLVELARAPEEELDDLLHYQADLTLARMMISAWDGDTAKLLHLIEHADMSPMAKTALFDTLARQTFDGRIPREETTAFLERFERECLADQDNEIWWDWLNTVTRLGVSALEPAVQRVLLKPAFEDAGDEEKADGIAELHRCAADPGSPDAFEEAGLRPIDDPFEALAWIAESIAALDRVAAETGLARPPKQPVSGDVVEDDAGHDPGNAPGAQVGLHPPEFDWLARFLVSRQVTASTMPLVMVDGYLTALALGPEIPKPESFVPLIWGEDGEEPVWHGDQKAVVNELLGRHFLSILERRAAGALQQPIIEGTEDLEIAAIWADGFVAGLDTVGEAWEPLLADRRGGEDVMGIAALSGNEELLERPATADECAQIIARLPRTLQLIAEYWSDPSRGYHRSAPVRVQKVGRNDPCPCGSGKKYKKCCGLNPPPTLN